MKKYIIGAVFGFLLATAFSAHADEVISLIGKQVQGTFPVKVFNKMLSDQAIVIDGTSYLPVRAIGEALNMQVSFDSQTGISLSNGINQEKINKINDLKKQSDDLTKQIEDLYQVIKPYEVAGYGPNGVGMKQPDDTYYTTKKKRDDLIAQRDAIDKQIQDLQNQQ